MTVLWHVSDDPAIARFEPRANERHDSPEVLVWAIDDAHVPAYWFPRECPRGTFWAIESSSDEDVRRFLGGDRSLRVHALQADWLEEFRSARLWAYRLPPETFEPYDGAAGYWVSREAVEPWGVEDLGGSLRAPCHRRHRAASRSEARAIVGAGHPLDARVQRHPAPEPGLTTIRVGSRRRFPCIRLPVDEMSQFFRSGLTTRRGSTGLLRSG